MLIFAWHPVSFSVYTHLVYITIKHHNSLQQFVQTDKVGIWWWLKDNLLQFYIKSYVVGLFRIANEYPQHTFLCRIMEKLSQPMRLWYLSHRRPAMAQASLRICTVSLEPSLLAHMKYGSRRRVRPKIRHLAPLNGCECAFKEWVYGEWKIP